MDPTIFSHIPADVAVIARSGEHRADQDNAPKPYKPGTEQAFRERIAHLLAALSTAHLTTLASDGWPVGNAVRFTAAVDFECRPILYIFARLGARKLANIANDPRVSLETHFAAGFERRRQTKSVQFQGVASLVVEPEERYSARTAAEAKYGAVWASGLGADNAALIRLDVLSAVNFDASGRPQWGQIDYLANRRES